MKRSLTAWVVATLAATPLPAQEGTPAEHQAVLAVVDSFFSAMTRHDSLGSRAVLLPGAMFYSVVPGRAPGSTPDRGRKRADRIFGEDSVPWLHLPTTSRLTIILA